MTTCIYESFELIIIRLRIRIYEQLLHYVAINVLADVLREPLANGAFVSAMTTMSAGILIVFQVWSVSFINLLDPSELPPTFPLQLHLCIYVFYCNMLR